MTYEHLATNRPGRILLVEDDEEQTHLLRAWLEQGTDFELVIATSAEDARKELLSGGIVYDLLLSDVRLPGLGGGELAVLAREVDPLMSIVLMSAHATLDDTIFALRAKVDDFVLKPLHRDLVVRRIRDLVIQSRTARVSEARTVLAVGAHPDDVEIGCGGSLMNHVEAGDRVVLLVLTDGAKGGDAERRRNEAEDAAAMMGAEIVFGGLPDTRLSPGTPTIDVIRDVIDRVRPSVVYTHSENDQHQDHQSAHRATLVAARTVPTIRCYQSPSTTLAFSPRTFVDVSEMLDKKLDLLSCFATQTVRRAYLEPGLIRATARYWSRFALYRDAEPFEVIRAAEVKGQTLAARRSTPTRGLPSAHGVLPLVHPTIAARSATPLAETSLRPTCRTMPAVLRVPVVRPSTCSVA